MKLYRLNRLFLLAALAMPWAASAASASDPLAERHAEALLAYENCHWATAFQAFSALADEGHRPSARVALLMAARGPALYGQSFEAGAPQRQRWAGLQAWPVDTETPAAAQRLAGR
ncbi:MAG: hypothetical protein JNL87_02325 [Burkholderiaceae bacterium]|nr:hypothetical protein [Burkholderiaceae bacterium]